MHIEYFKTEDICRIPNFKKIDFLNTLFFIKNRMSNQDLLDASQNGNLKAVKSLLEKKNIDVNCKDILI